MISLQKTDFSTTETKDNFIFHQKWGCENFSYMHPMAKIILLCVLCVLRGEFFAVDS
jgi:hypothetical protein